MGLSDPVMGQARPLPGTTEGEPHTRLLQDLPPQAGRGWLPQAPRHHASDTVPIAWIPECSLCAAGENSTVTAQQGDLLLPCLSEEM